MNERQKQRIELLTTFCGYGNPATAEIFFMGIEEHHTLPCFGDQSIEKLIEELIIVRNKNKEEWTYSPSCGRATGKTERTQYDLYTHIFGDGVTEDEIFQNKIHCFNYYPLGANSQKEYPSHYNVCFGFNFKLKSDLYNYFENQTKRKEILKSFILTQIIKKNKLLFVLGKSGWKKAEDLFPDYEFKNNFSAWSNKKREKPSMIKWSDNKQIWFTGHPSYGWINNEVIEKIASIRREK